MAQFLLEEALVAALVADENRQAGRTDHPGESDVRHRHRELIGEMETVPGV